MSLPSPPQSDATLSDSEPEQTVVKITEVLTVKDLDLKQVSEPKASVNPALLNRVSLWYAL